MVDNYENYQFLLEKYEIIETIIEKISQETFFSTTKIQRNKKVLTKKFDTELL